MSAWLRNTTLGQLVQVLLIGLLALVVAAPLALFLIYWMIQSTVYLLAWLHFGSL